MRASSENLGKSVHDKDTIRYAKNLRAAGKTESEIAAILAAEKNGEKTSPIGEKLTPQEMQKLIENNQINCPP